MASDEPRKGDDEMTLWIGGVMLLITVILCVLWIQQTRRLQASQVKCQNLEAAKAELESKMDAGVLMGSAGRVTAAEGRTLGLKPGDIVIVDDVPSAP